MENNKFYNYYIYVLFGFLCFNKYFKIKKTSAAFAAEVCNCKYYLCFLVLNLPPLISFSKKEPLASPTSVSSTAVEFTDVGEAFGSFLEKEIKGGKFKTKKQR